MSFYTNKIWSDKDLFPTGGAFAPAGILKNTLFVTNQFKGLYKINVSKTGAYLKLVLSLKDRIDKTIKDGRERGGPFADERGILGIVFHPHFGRAGAPNQHSFFVYYSVSRKTNFGTALGKVAPAAAAADHYAVLSRFLYLNGKAKKNTERRVLIIPQDFFNHNGGSLTFGTDGMLYVGIGDGGGQRDQNGPLVNQVDPDSFFGRAQDLSDLHGKILRINVDNVTHENPYQIPLDNPFVGSSPITQNGEQITPRTEIYAYGFRNPWKFSFGYNGKLYVADVGQNEVEEVNTVEAGGNYGWRAKEGSTVFNSSLHSKLIKEGRQFKDPIIEYNHNPEKRFAIIGGYTVAVSKDKFVYVFGDYNGEVFAPSDTKGGFIQIHRFATEHIHSFAATPDLQRLFVFTRTHRWLKEDKNPHKGRIQEIFIRDPPLSLTDANIETIFKQARESAQLTESALRKKPGGDDDDDGTATTAAVHTQMHISVYIPDLMNTETGSYKTYSMKNAWDGSLPISRAKAYTAYAFSSKENALTTRTIGELSQPGKPLWHIGNVSNEKHGIIEFPGGLPLYKKEEGGGGQLLLVGGIGVSGDAVDQDETVATAAAEGFKFK